MSSNQVVTMLQCYIVLLAPPYLGQFVVVTLQQSSVGCISLSHTAFPQPWRYYISMSLWARLIFDIYLESHGAIYMYLYYMKLHRTLILMNQHYFIVIYGLDWRCSFSEYFISEYSQSSARQPQDFKVLSRNLFDSQCQSKITLRNKHKWKLELQSRRNNVYEEKNKNKNSP